jgi:hypothetical protein
MSARVGERTRVRPAWVLLDGEEGNDVLAGGRRGDYFPLSPGDDILRGRRGPDSFEEGFTFGYGSDALLGGRGGDEILADDHVRDQRIDSGPGRDHVWFDYLLDPKPVACEKKRQPQR